MADQGLADLQQVVEKILGIVITGCLIAHVIAVDGALHQLEIAPQTVAHDGELAAVGLLAVAMGPVCEHGLVFGVVAF